MTANITIISESSLIRKKKPRKLPQQNKCEGNRDAAEIKKYSILFSTVQYTYSNNNVNTY